MSGEGCISKFALQDNALAKDTIGRAAMEDQFVNAAKIEDLAVTAAKLAANNTKELISVGPLLLADALNFPVYFNHKVTINKVRSVLTVVIADADLVCTLKDNDGTSMANGALTIATAGAAVGDEDSCSPTDHNVVAANNKIILALDGGPSAGEAIFFIEFTKTD